MPVASSEPAINKLNYASNLMALTKEFNIITLPGLILLLDYKVHTASNITRFVGLEVRDRKGRLPPPNHPYQKHHRYSVYITCPQPESVHFNKRRRLPAHENHTTDEHKHPVLRVTRHWIRMNGQLQILNALITRLGVHWVGSSSSSRILFVCKC